MSFDLLEKKCVSLILADNIVIYLSFVIIYGESSEICSSYSPTFAMEIVHTTTLNRKLISSSPYLIMYVLMFIIICISLDFYPPLYSIDLDFVTIAQNKVPALSCWNQKWLTFATSIEPGQHVHLWSLTRL